MRSRRISTIPLLLALVFLPTCLTLAQDSRAESQGPSVADPSGTEIMKRSLDRYRANLDAAHDYTYQEREVSDWLDKDGDPKKVESQTHEVLMIYGEPYEKLIAKDDKPLSEHDEKKEQEKLDKVYAERKKKWEALHGDPNTEDREARKIRGKYDKEQEKQRKIADEMLQAMSIRKIGEEEIAGQQVWVLQAEPVPGYSPHDMVGRLLTKLRGRIWVEKNSYEWVKAEADMMDDFSVGLFLFKLRKGTHVEFEQTRINDEVWLPKRVFLNGGARLLVKNARFQLEDTYSNYRKFRTDSKITGIVSSDTPASDPMPPSTDH